MYIYIYIYVFISGLSLSTCIFPNELPRWKRILLEFPFLLSSFLLSSFFFHNVPSLSLSSMLSCPLIYICCSFHGHSMCVFHHYSHVFVPCGVIWSPLFSCPLTFSRPFLLQCSLPFLFFYVLLAHWSIFAVVSTGILCVSFATIATCVCSAE